MAIRVRDITDGEEVRARASSCARCATRVRTAGRGTRCSSAPPLGGPRAPPSGRQHQRRPGPVGVAGRAGGPPAGVGGRRHRLSRGRGVFAGVARQYSGTLGKVGNCQRGVSVQQLFLPDTWDGPQAEARRRACRIPDTEHHRPKWQLALDMLDQLSGTGLRPAVRVADAGCGASPTSVTACKTAAEPAASGAMASPRSRQGRGKASQGAGAPEYWTYSGAPDNAARCGAGRRWPGKIRKRRLSPRRRG